jgi:hypothetical protein
MASSPPTIRVFLLSFYFCTSSSTTLINCAVDGSMSSLRPVFVDCLSSDTHRTAENFYRCETVLLQKVFCAYTCWEKASLRIEKLVNEKEQQSHRLSSVSAIFDITIHLWHNICVFKYIFKYGFVFLVIKK